jgi:hypothetical protein
MRITKETIAPEQSTIFPPETIAPSVDQGEETGTALALIGTQPAALIYAPGALTALVDRLKTEVRGQLATLDVSIPKDKARIISLSAKVASAKVSLDKAGDSLIEEHRAVVTAVNADRKAMRDDLDAFKIEVRKPVTDLENAEKERVAGHEAALAEITAAAAFSADNWQHLGSIAISERIQELAADFGKRNWQEFSVRAEGTKAIAMRQMDDALFKAQQAEKAVIEAESLRAEAAERAIKEREEAAALAAKQAAERKAEEQARIAREAAEREQKRVEREAQEAEARAKQAEAERVAAEEKAARDLVEAEERRKREAEQAEAERVAAEEKAARDLVEAEERRKREAEQAEARRIADIESAKRREEQAAAQSKRNQEAAIEAERQRVAAEKRRELEEAEKRAKNRAHLAAVNREVLADLVALGATEEFGKVLIEGIVKGNVRHTTIAY